MPEHGSQFTVYLFSVLSPQRKRRLLSQQLSKILKVDLTGPVWVTCSFLNQSQWTNGCDSLCHNREWGETPSEVHALTVWERCYPKENWGADGRGRRDWFRVKKQQLFTKATSTWNLQLLFPHMRGPSPETTGQFIKANAVELQGKELDTLPHTHSASSSSF